MFRIGLAALALVAGASCARSAAAEETQGQLEYCASWTTQNGQWGATNTCEQTIVIHLKVGDARDATLTVEKGHRLVTNLPGEPDSFMATVCPLGYEPNLPFDLRNAEEIYRGAYHCVKH